MTANTTTTKASRSRHAKTAHALALVLALALSLPHLCACQSDLAAEAGSDVSEAQASSTLDTSEWDGASAYVEINGNVPSFTEGEIADAAEGTYESYSPLDDLGRVGVAQACLGTETMPDDGQERGDISSVCPSGWEQECYEGVVDDDYLYNRCHLIAWSLSAEDANEENLMTGTRYFNVEGMLPFEEAVASYIDETCNHVLYRVTPVFDGDDLLAQGIEIEALSVEDSGEGVSFHIFCYNVQPGIDIDYSDGTSSLSDSSTALSKETEDGDGEDLSGWLEDNSSEILALVRRLMSIGFLVG